ncbi:MAG: CocE/NonD family hydrolase [Myxococcales bacterium]
MRRWLLRLFTTLTVAACSDDAPVQRDGGTKEASSDAAQAHDDGEAPFRMDAQIESAQPDTDEAPAEAGQAADDARVGSDGAVDGGDHGHDAGKDASAPEDAGKDASAPEDAGKDASAPEDAGKDASAPEDAGDGCRNGVKDGTESDTDCGGDTCARCAQYKHCKNGSDCAPDHKCGSSGTCVKRYFVNVVSCGPNDDNKTCATGSACTRGFCFQQECILQSDWTTLCASWGGNNGEPCAHGCDGDVVGACLPAPSGQSCSIWDPYGGPSILRHLRWKRQHYRLLHRDVTALRIRACLGIFHGGRGAPRHDAVRSSPMRTRLVAAAALLGLTAICVLLYLGLATRESVRVRMPDGAMLATDVWRPWLHGKPRPVLLRRTPYGRGIRFREVQRAIMAGYSVVSQDVRGRGESDGEFLPFFDDKIDGKATLDWIAQQPWSNGRVGSYGSSAEGIVQYMAMASAPRALRCASVGMPTHDVYAGMYPGGAWRTELGTRWLEGLHEEPVIAQWKAHEVRDSYWDAATLSRAEMANIAHPVFILGGLFDIFASNQVRALSELQAHVAPSARRDVFLVLGPWTHGGPSERGQGQLLFPADTPYAGFDPEFIAYFDWCLRGEPRPDLAPVRYYVMEVTDRPVKDPDAGTSRFEARGEWRTGPRWPPSEAPLESLYLGANGSLASSPADAAPASVPCDPLHPVPSHGGGNLTTPAGPFEQSAIDARPDVLVFQTPPVPEVTEIVGNPRAELWVASATSDVDVVVRLEVVTRGGHVFALTDGIARGRFAGGTGRLTPLVPGEATKLEVELGPVALRLARGQSLRIAISGSSSPRYEPNPNRAEPLARKPAPVTTTLSVWRDANHASHVILPFSTAGVRPEPLRAPDSEHSSARSLPRLTAP